MQKEVKHLWKKQLFLKNARFILNGTEKVLNAFNGDIFPIKNSDDYKKTLMLSTLAILINSS